AEGVVAADGDQVIEVEALDVLEDGLGDVEDFGGDALLGEFVDGERLAFEHRGQFLHLGRIGARTVQVGSAGAIDGPGIFAIQRQHVAGAARRILKVDVGKAFPAAANTDHLAADFTSTVYHRLDHGIESRNVAATRENT